MRIKNFQINKQFYFVVWILENGKCIRTFKHKKPVTAVALGEDLCLSGCEAGNVKVWNMKTGKLIKVQRFQTKKKFSRIHYQFDRLNVSAKYALGIIKF